MWKEISVFNLFYFDILLRLAKFKATAHLKEVGQSLRLEQQPGLDLRF